MLAALKILLFFDAGPYLHFLQGKVGRMKIFLNRSSSVITFVEILIMCYMNVFRITYLWIVCIFQDGKKKKKNPTWLQLCWFVCVRVNVKTNKDCKTKQDLDFRVISTCTYIIFFMTTLLYFTKQVRFYKRLLTTYSKLSLFCTNLI